MTTQNRTPTSHPGQRSARRLLGVDIARGVALLGMFSVHLLPGADGGATGAIHQLSLGRASALFAVLSGVGLALATGGATPWTGSLLRRGRLATVTRGLLVLAIGLIVGAFTTPAAVILCYYGMLFVVASLFLGLTWRPLAALAAVAALATPWLSLLLRQAGLDDTERVNLAFDALPDARTALLTVLLTGYYPVLTWLTYLLAGLTVGRLALGRPRVAAAVAGTGAALALAASVVSALVVRSAGGVQGLDESFFGVTPVPDPIWLWIRAPHSGSVADLVHTTGTALLVIGLTLLATPYLGRWATALAAPGSVPLTLYTLHVISLGLLPREMSAETSALALVVSVAAALGVAAAAGAPARRGPLEEFVAVTVRAVVRPLAPERH